MARLAPLALLAAAACAVVAGVGAAGCAGCGDELPPARVRPLPAPDDRAAIAPTADGQPRTPRLASYVIAARLDAAAHRIEATQTLTWKNGGQSPVDRMPLHLYMNGFKNEDSLLMRESRGSHRASSFDGTHWGWIDVTSIQVGGVELRDRATFAGPGADETVLEVPLPAPVAPGQTVQLELAFTTQLPAVFARTGFHGAFTMVGQWFPKVGVRVGPPGAERWVCEPFHLNSEFFADFGTYDVQLTVPATHVVAATGVLTSAVDGGDGTHTLTYRAEDVHDFAWMADPHMEVLRGDARVGDRTVEVRVYHRPAQREFARRHLVAGVGAIEQFSELFVPYPWPIMSIIDPPVGADGAAGMEYPTLVTTGGDSWWARDGVRLPELVTIHEVGHNWFQGMLASNEAAEGWLDEGVNDWADAEVMARLWGGSAEIVDWLGISLEIHRAMQAFAAPGSSVPSPIQTVSWEFVDFDAYADASYRKTSAALKTLENVVGREAFLAAMRGYAERWAFKHPTARDLFAAIEDGVGQDLGWFWGPVFQGTGGVDFAVRTISCLPAHASRGVFGYGEDRKEVTAVEPTGALRCEVVVVNRGSVAVPVDIELRFADGSTLRCGRPGVADAACARWDQRGAGRWYRIELERSSPIVEVQIDPDGEILLSENLLDDHVRVSPDERASWRAAARLTFWTHTAMQVLGL
jgi:hypothetical protein